MAFISCGECGESISDMAETCIYCGFHHPTGIFRQTEMVHADQTKRLVNWTLIISGIGWLTLPSDTQETLVLVSEGLFLAALLLRIYC